MLKRILSPFKDFGAFAGLLYLVDSALCLLSTKTRLFFYEIMAQPIPDKDLIPPNLTKNLEVREITQSDPELENFPVAREIINFRLQQNAVCLGAFKKEKLTGYIWLSFNTYDEDEVRCRFLLTPEAESVFDFDLYIYPEHRLGLAFMGLWNGTNEYLRSRGVKQSYSRLSRFNLESRKSHKHFGWECVGKLIFIQLWKIEIMLGSIFPFVYVSFGENSRVKLKLRPDVLAK